MNNQTYTFVGMYVLMAIYRCSCDEPGIQEMPFSLKFKGSESLTPKGCCDGLEAMPSWWGGVFGDFGWCFFFLDVTHKFSPPVASKSACACNTDQEVLASAPGVQRGGRLLQLCIAYAEVLEPQSQFPIQLSHTSKEPGTTWDSPQENPRQFAFVN